MKIKIAVIAALLIGLSACSSPTSYTGKASPAASLGAAQKVDLPGTTQTNTDSLPVQTVKALNAICTNLAPFLNNPSNWRQGNFLADTGQYEMYVFGGDGGEINLLVTPGLPRAALAVAPSLNDATNSLLYYQGCQSITTEPDISNQAEITVPSQEQGIVIPNFNGQTEKDARSWLATNLSYASVQVNPESIEDQYTACSVNQFGPVVNQSPAAGATVVNSQSTRITLTVDCTRSHWK